MDDTKCCRCGYCCTEMEINILDLVHPEQLLPPKGFEFYKAHGLDEVLRRNGKVRILHNCQFLKDGNVCTIQDNKPDYCREWVCRRHLRDSEWFKNRRGEIAFETISEISRIVELDMFEVSLKSKLQKTLDEFFEQVEELGGEKK